MNRKKIYFAAIAFSLFAIVFAVGFSPNFGSLIAKANGYYLEISAGSPLNENWTDTSRINVDDDWANVVAIEAFTGAGLVVGPGFDPRTVLADNPAGTLDVKANETNPATSAAEGVAEFQIANPTIALKATDAAPAPNLVIHINTTIGCVGKGVAVDFNVRDIDDSARNAPTQVVTQYRIGGSGNYTSLNASYIADATTGPSQATLVTSEHVTLPIGASGQPKVDIRIITTNSPFADEWIGIDDIKIDCIHPTSATAFVGGRVVDAFGRGISRAQVSVLNTATSNRITVTTNAFGYYSFGELEVGNFYMVTIGSKTYNFKNNQQMFQLFEDMNEVNFVAN
jgi:hypothetical protein